MDFSDSEFMQISDFSRRNYGIQLDLSKKQLVYSRLIKVLRREGVSSFGEFCARLRSRDVEVYHDILLSSLTTNVTSFFREKHHFDVIRENLVPVWKKRLTEGGSVRLWSAGCSTGQEPYSLALSLVEAWPEICVYDFKILATDIDPEVLKVASLGMYPAGSMGDAERSIFDRWLKSDPVENVFKMGKEVKDLVSFGRLNLIDKWPFAGKMDLIMFRNVAIYFDLETQEMIWRKFSEKLKDGAHLMIGHSERVSNLEECGLAPDGVTTYLKKF